MPNIVYVNGDLSVNANREGWGVFYVTGDTTLGGNGSVLNGILICLGNITMNGNSHIDGGIIHYGQCLYSSVLLL